MAMSGDFGSKEVDIEAYKVSSVDSCYPVITGCFGLGRHLMVVGSAGS